ncbi:MAG TPA: hypothetical protein VL017_02095, partial [Devosia sp.]|nr:hypothetical protein [Devosia sp.]
MSTHRTTIQLTLLAGIISTTLAACHGDSPVGPVERTQAIERSASSRKVCASECVLATGMTFLQAVAPRPDSTTPLILGDFRIRGEPGATVAVALEADGQLADGMSRNGVLLVKVNGGLPQHVAFKSLLHGNGAVVYRFTSATEVRLQYAVERNLTVPQVGSFRLEQHLSEATILEGTAPWGTQVTSANLTATATNCAATDPSGTSCGVEYTISPFVAYGDGSFSDAGCCGPSGPITVTFAAPVGAVTATIYDPTYAGSHMVAHSTLGDFTAGFAYSGQPGNNVPNTQTLEAPGIYSVDLVPSSGVADGDWVTWRLWFGAGPSLIVSCTPNPVLRGEQVVCTAQSSDSVAAPLVMSSWKFVGPALSDPIIETSSSTTWS